MGWKGNLRSISAAARAAERNAKRRQRELELRRKQYEKMVEIEQAEFEVEVYENHIDVIQSLHKECGPVIDWDFIAKSSEPEEPKISKKKEENARFELENYKPNIIDKLFKREQKKIDLLKKEINIAIETDYIDYKEKHSDWEKRFSEWEDEIRIAKLLMNGDIQTKIDTINNLQRFSEISNLGSSIRFLSHENGLIEAEIYVHGSNIVPREVKSLLKSGKLSIKNMPSGRFNEIYQDYVCSSTLRVANELFAILPDQLVIVTAIDELLNSATGHLEKSPILSAVISRKTINKLNLESIDPSDSMNNFIHAMSFKKTKGFDKVDRINPQKIEYQS